MELSFRLGLSKMELNLGQRILVKLAECTIIGFLENHQLFEEKQLRTLIILQVVIYSVPNVTT